MVTYLLTWNPKEWPATWAKERRQIRAEGAAETDWSTRSKHVQPGDRVFLLRQREEPRGIMASGVATSAVWRGEHWRHDGTMCDYVDLTLDTLLILPTYPPLPRKALDGGVLRVVNWNTRRSGIAIPSAAAEELERRWREYLRWIGWSTSSA